MDTTHLSTFRALAMADRVVLVHDTAARVTTSELAVEQAALLLRQLQIAVSRAHRFQAVMPDSLIHVAIPTPSRH